ncbi:MAG: LysM peptidoglycan-binding domain-containing protein, partial [Pseudomonadota bacterium]
MKNFSACYAIVAVLVLGACSSRPVQAPVIDRVPPSAGAPVRPSAAGRLRPAETDTRPESYVVKRGDTLYSIALDHGLDYKEFAAWNNLDNPNVIRVGQALRIKPPAGAQEAPVTVTPVTGPGSVGMLPLSEQGAIKSETRPLSAQGTIKSEPRARKLPYSEENVALLQGGGALPGPKIEPEPVPAQTPKQEPAAKDDAGLDDEDKVEWG